MDIVCASPCAHQFCFVQVRRRSFWGGCGSIRRLFGEIAVIRAEKRGFYRTFFYSLTSAISPRSVRIPEFSKLNSWEPLVNDFLRERITHIGKQSDLHKLYPSPIPL